ncbi:hypothetical protein EYF80_019531 [Liparis tanakae]|uniref:Uncharacterized protein n=1 Tax=Liparis tanakae TaxID=230148 RepID=A0A4Z2HXA7_9TELE|nr:hypothetical protein EYF80_019531 [Liparis tanakae]
MQTVTVLSLVSIMGLSEGLSVRSSFWLEEEQEMGGLPGTMQGELGMMSWGIRPMLWDMGVRYDV